MSIVFTPRHRPLGPFRMGTASWAYLLGVAGPVIPGFWQQSGPRWYRIHVDPRFKDTAYPEVLGDSGRHFYVKAPEARQLANVARNWATIQQVLPEEHNMDARLGTPEYMRPFPERVRDDWPPLFLAFADWAERSRGFSK